MEDKMTKEETAFRKRLEALPQMTNREAMEIILGMAKEYNIDGISAEELEAINHMEDYMNDLMREEPSTGLEN